jgi:hypothetical protein
MFGPGSFFRAVFPGKGNKSRIIPAAAIHRNAVRFTIFQSSKSDVDILHNH